MNKRELEDAIRDEVAEWPGVTVEFENATGTGHPKAKLMFGELILRRPYASTPSDSYHGLHKCLGDMRRIMRQLGAERAKPEPSSEEIEKRYTKPNPGREMRQLPESEKAAVKPDVADQLVDAGAATPEQATKARAAARIVYVADDDETEDDAAREQRTAEFKARVAAIVDGIYFNLPAEIYHAVEALGSGSVCDLIVSAGTFWRGSWLDPDRPELDEEATKAQILGKAYHTARLEPQLFNEQFVRELSKADFPAKGLLTSDVAVKAALKDMGEQQTVTGESIEERCQRLLDAGYQGTLWPLEKARWQAKVAGRTPIPAKFWDDIERDMERLRSIDDIREKLEGGAPEVSVFWTDKFGVRCKARFDYLRADLWDDFKTFVNSNGKVLAQAIADAVRYNRIYIQCIHYREAAEEIRNGRVQIVGDASDEERAIIAAIQIRPIELACWLIFQEKNGVPNLLARQFKFKSVSLNDRAQLVHPDPAEQAMMLDRAARPNGLFKLGEAEILHAKRQFVLYSQVYPPGQPWAPIDPIGTIDDDDFNSYWLEGR